jgi:hypothetical protein
MILLLATALLGSAELIPTLTLTGDYTSNDGVDYTGYYTLTVNPPGTNILAMCINDAITIQTGDVWNAELISLDQYETDAGLTATQGKEVAWLFEQVALNPSNDGGVPAISDAAWTIVSLPDSNAGLSNVDYWVDQAGKSSNYNSINPNNFSVWVPLDSRDNLDLQLSQPFLVDSSCPEPLSFALVGIGLLGFARMAKRRIQ